MDAFCTDFLVDNLSVGWVSDEGGLEGGFPVPGALLWASLYYFGMLRSDHPTKSALTFRKSLNARAQ